MNLVSYETDKGMEVAPGRVIAVLVLMSKFWRCCPCSADV
jgi:hypothetical protein